LGSCPGSGEEREIINEKQKGLGFAPQQGQVKKRKGLKEKKK
jgi:hypothetical protein